MTARHTIRGGGLIALGLAALLSAPAPALAIASFSFTSGSPLTAAEHTSVEILGPTGVVMRIRGAQPAEVQQRAQSITSRLNGLLERGARAETLWVRPIAAGALLGAGDSGIVTVTAEDAAANATTVEALAQAWLGRLRQAFSEPYFAVPEHPLVIPLQGEREAPLVGPLADEVALTSAVPNLVQARRATPAALLLRGLAEGEATLTFSARGRSVQVTAQVLPLAAEIVPGLTLRLSGPATEEQVRSALAAHLREAVRLMPGCSVALQSFTYDAQLLSRQGKAPLYADVLASGPGFAPLRAQATFTLERVTAPRRAPLALWVSNEPESLVRPGMLLHAQVPPGASVRLFYHHQNAGYAPSALVIWAVSPGVEAPLHLLGAAATAPRDPLLAGRDAALGFLRALSREQGFFVNVSGARAVLAQTLGPRETASGLYEIANGSPEPVEIIIETRGPRDWSTGPLQSSLNSPLSKEALYPAERQRSIVYRTGADWGTFELGRAGELSLSPRTEFRGNYGVLHRLTFRAVNNGSSNQEVELACYAGGGRTVVVYQFGGSEARATGVLPAYGEARLAQATLKPGEERTWELLTVPLGGAFYPVSLLLRPTG